MTNVVAFNPKVEPYLQIWSWPIRDTGALMYRVVEVRGKDWKTLTRSYALEAEARADLRDLSKTLGMLLRPVIREAPAEYEIVWPDGSVTDTIHKEITGEPYLQIWRYDAADGSGEKRFQVVRVEPDDTWKPLTEYLRSPDDAWIQMWDLAKADNLDCRPTDLLAGTWSDCPTGGDAA